MYRHTLTKHFLFILLFCTFISYCSKKGGQADGRIHVAASIAPLADFCRQIGGDRLEVFIIIPPGSNPHTFELTPELLQRITTSDLLVLNGIGLEYWAEKVIDNLSHTKVIITSDGLEIIEENSHHHAEGNPHIWLNPQNAIFQVNKISKILQLLSPQDAHFFQEKTDRYIQTLKKLDNSIRSTIDTWQHKNFVCFHPAWEYFAREYGLSQVAVIEKKPGDEPSPQEIVNIIKILKEINASALFAESQFPQKICETIAQESQIKVIQLDPIGGTNGLITYQELISYNVQQMQRGLK